MKVLFLSTNLNNLFLVVGSQHLTELLAERHDVTLVAAPMRRRWRSGFARQPTFWSSRRGAVVVQAAAPWLVPFKFAVRSHRLRMLYGRLLTALPTAANRILKQRYDCVVIDELIFACIVERVQARRVIYRPTDVYPDMLGSPHYRSVERELLKRSCWVVCTSEPVRSHISDLGYPLDRTTLLENGVDFPSFAQAKSGRSELAAVQGKKALYVGVVDDRFDAELLAEVARRLPAWTFFIVGPTIKRIGELPLNVRVLGPRVHRDTPLLMADADVGIMPLSRHAANRGRSPMKIYEYLAVGIPVVSTTTKELQRRALAGVSLADDADRFASMIECAAVDPDLARRVSSGHSWGSKARVLEELMVKLVANEL